MLLRDTLGFISLLQCLKPSGSNRWPAGTYGIPKPDSGCPKTDHFQWLEGWRSQGSNSNNLNNSCSAEFHLDGTVDNTKVNRSFCIKDDTKYDSIRPTWPKGQYCIYKKGECPYVMHIGFVEWDDENSLNANSKGGTCPAGKYVGDNTEIRFCCRTDGNKREPIILPTKLPFFLLAYGSGECQMVKWAIATSEWIYYDTEKVNNRDDRRWPYPYNAETRHPTIHYCYYRETTTAASTLSVITKSTTSKEYTTTKGGAKGDKTEQSEEKVPTSSNPNLSSLEVLSKEATVALSVLGAILFLLVFAFVCFIRHQRKQIVEYRNQLFPIHTGKHQIDNNRTLLEQCNDLPYDPDFEFPEDKLILGELLGSGAFGKVIKAEAIGINNKSQKKSQRRPKTFGQHTTGHAYHDPRGSAYTKTTVAVKTVKEGATKEEVRDLASELKILIYVGEHKNIVNLLGVCIKRDRILVILEYAPHGSLQKFLRDQRDVYEATWTTTASDPEIGLNISNLVSYSYQISRGMEYLASKRCVHRHLATRNVLVGEDYVMKIADFGLARDIYKSELYVRTSSGVLPIKWMAIESLLSREYSEKSDVWSFGICLWEIFTLGGTPYPTIPVEELLNFLNDGNRMENPRDCPLEIYKIMQDCWQEVPDKRPKFDQISQSIGTILEQHASQSVATEYLELTEVNNRGREDYYLDPHDSDPTVPVTRAYVYDRQSSENIANNPLPPLPGDMEDQFDPESEERRQRLKPEIYGCSSGSEGDIELEEFHGNE